MKKTLSFSIALLLCSILFFNNAEAQLNPPKDTTKTAVSNKVNSAPPVLPFSQGTWPHVENGILVKDAESIALKRRTDSIAAKNTADSLLTFANQKQQTLQPAQYSFCGPNSCDAEVMWLVTQLLAEENADPKMVSNSLFRFNYLLVDAKNGTLTVSYKTIKDLRSSNKRLARNMKDNILREMWARVNREHDRRKSLDLAGEFSKQTGTSFVPDKRKRNSF